MNDERRPQAPSESTTTTASLAQGTDLASMRHPDWHAYLDARRDGYLEGEVVGYARGYRACDDELATLQREAHKVVLLMAGIDPYEVRQARAVGRR